MWPALISAFERVKGAVIGVAAIAVAILTAYAMGRTKGKHTAEIQATRDQAAEDMAEAREIINAAEDRRDAEAQIVEYRRDSGVSSADRLRDEWSRD